MRYLKSRDLTQKWEVPEWFYNYWKEVHTGPNRFAYLQAVSTGNGKKEPFAGHYNYKQSIECYVDYRAMPPQVKLVYNPKSDTYCNFNTGTCCGFLGRKDIERAVWEQHLDANKLIDFLKTADNVKMLDHLPTWKNNGNLVTDNSVIIAGQYDEIGHIAPVPGYGKDGDLFATNKGSNDRDGIRKLAGKDKDTAFYANIEDIIFFEVYR